MSRKPLNRRTFLRGAGTIAIALPFLDAMRPARVHAASAETPARAFNIFFGLGFPTPLQSEGWDGPLHALTSMKDKLLIVRGVDQVRCDEAGINAHFDGAAGAFTAEAPNGEALSGGPSLDQVLRVGAYPNGMPSGVFGALLAGTYFRRSRPARYIHSWRDDGSPADLPAESPAQLFTKIFGSLPVEPGGGNDKADRYRKSVLDSVIGQYQHWQSDASNLGKASRARIADHLDRVRELEQRAFGNNTQACTTPPKPGDSTVPHGGAADPDGEGIDITVTDLVGEWRTLAELYALAITCDLARFGGITFQAAGERIRLTGNYDIAGRSHTFADKDRRGVGGALGCSHEWWHAFGETKPNDDLRSHLELLLGEVAYFMNLLDKPDDADTDGGTILENSMITITTESGDGRHNDVKRELSGVFHAITSAGGRFKTGGQIVDVNQEGVHLYNTMLAAHGVPGRLGPSGMSHSSVDQILV